MRSWSIVGVAVLAAVGCGRGEPYAPVSGQVMLDGRPLAGAMVEFLPVAHDQSPNPGPSSTGRTDAQGKYTLQVVDSQQMGAVPGRHRVRITAFAGELPRTTDDANPQVPAQILPERYNADTKLSYEVPAQGTTTANFTLVSDPKLVPVSGIITLDGQPLAGARVVFEPIPRADQPQFPISSGTTNAAGKFTLQVEKGKKAGAVLGKHRVRISMDKAESPAAGEKPETKKRMRSIPERYNTKSTLICEVTDTENASFNFDLASDRPGADKERR
jgi:hypothetical protein